MGGAPRSTAVCVLLASLVLGGTTPVAALAGPSDGSTSASLAGADDGLLDGSTDTLEDTTGTVTGTVNDTTDSVTGSVNDTTDSVTGTVDDTTGTVTGTVNDTTEALTGAVDGTSDSLSTAGDGDDGLLDRSTREESPSYRLLAALAGNGDRNPQLLRVSGGPAPGVDRGAVATLLSRDGADPEAGDSGGTDVSVADAAAATGAPSETPLPDVPPEGVAGGGVVGAIAVGALIRQGIVSSGSPGVVASAATGPVAAATSDTLDRLVRLFAPLRYSRFDDSDPLDHDVRDQLYTVVDRSPGAYLSEVSERAGVPLSTARHHARILEREGLVVSAKVRGRRRFYPGATDGHELAAALNDEPTAGLLDALARVGPTSVSALAEELDRDPSTVTHHLTRLEEDGLVVRERDGRAIRNRLSPEAAAALDSDVDSEARSEAVATAD